MAVGPSMRLTATSHAPAVSPGSPGRITHSPGMARRAARCSMGWWVGPSSPRNTESWLHTQMLGHFINADSRTAPRM